MSRPLRITFVADAQSPIARSWIDGVAGSGHTVQVLSTYPGAAAGERWAAFATLPTLVVRGTGARDTVRAMHLARDSGEGAHSLSPSATAGPAGLARRTLIASRRLAEAATAPIVGRAVLREVGGFEPDLVHALRIPHEAVHAWMALRDRPGVPFLVSSWGNDFTLHAASSRVLAALTTRVLRRADGFHADCERDVGLARTQGLLGTKPSLVVPGSGGLDTRMFVPAEVAPTAPVVLNPRSLRPYVRTDVFLLAARRVLDRRPDASFVGVGLAGSTEVVRLVEDLGIGPSVQLLPHVRHEAMASLYREARTTVSPSFHDGTPNTVLEAMACGSFPVVGDLASLREWIADGENGLLVDPHDPVSLGDAVLRSLDDDGLVERARLRNRELIGRRADRCAVMKAVDEFYRVVVGARER